MCSSWALVKAWGRFGWAMEKTPSGISRALQKAWGASPGRWRRLPREVFTFAEQKPAEGSLDGTGRRVTPMRSYGTRHRAFGPDATRLRFAKFDIAPLRVARFARTHYERGDIKFALRAATLRASLAGCLCNSPCGGHRTPSAGPVAQVRTRSLRRCAHRETGSLWTLMGPRAGLQKRPPETAVRLRLRPPRERMSTPTPKARAAVLRRYRPPTRRLPTPGGASMQGLRRGHRLLLQHALPAQPRKRSHL